MLGFFPISSTKNTPNRSTLWCVFSVALNVRVNNLVLKKFLIRKSRRTNSIFAYGFPQRMAMYV